MNLAALLLGLLLAVAPPACGSSVADAAENEDWEQASALLAAGEEANVAQPDGMTALHWAVYHGEQSAVTRLLRAGADPLVTTGYGVPPLSIACQNGEASLAKALLEAGADADAKLPGGETLLMTAARTGNDEVVALLLGQGAEINATEANGQTALMWAASAGNEEAVRVLLEAGAKIDLASRQGFNALHFAARDGRTGAAGLLLDAGADVNAAMQPKKPGGRAPRKGMSPLMLAVESAHFELALELVRRGAEVNDQRSGYTPLHAISWVRKANWGDNPNGDPEPRGSGKLNSLDFVRRLVAAGAETNACLEGNPGGPKQLRHKGCSPVLFAARTADLPLLELLVELGGDPLLPNRQGCTPLMACAGVGVQSVGEEAGTEPEVLETLTFLLDQGADVNTVDDNRETAMHGAAYRNFPRVVELLARHGADPKQWDHKNKSGWTPMRIAEGYRPGSFKPHPETQAALRDALGAFPSKVGSADAHE